MASALVSKSVKAVSGAQRPARVSDWLVWLRGLAVCSPIFLHLSHPALPSPFPCCPQSATKVQAAVEFYGPDRAKWLGE